MAEAQAVIQTEGLTCYFGRTCAVHELSFDVPRGCVFGLLGRNGSGKTTTIRMLLGLTPPTRGRGRVLGHDSANLPPDVRARVGFMAEGHPLYGWMRTGDAAHFQRGLHGVWDGDVFDRIVEHFNIDPSTRARNLSRGQRAGLSLALTLATRPELLVLDDPALGLDPVARQSLLEAILYFTREEGRTVFFSSHILADVERVADRIGVIRDGVLTACCSVESFREAVRKVVIRHDGERPVALPEIPGMLSAERNGTKTILRVVHFGSRERELLSSSGIVDYEESPMGFEEAIVNYLGRPGERGFLLSTPSRVEESAKGGAS